MVRSALLSLAKKPFDRMKNEYIFLESIFHFYFNKEAVIYFV